MVHEELCALLEQRRVRVVAQLRSNHLQWLEELGVKAQFQGEGHLAAFLVQQHGFVVLILLRKVRGRVNLLALRGLERQTHQLLVHVVLLRQLDCVTKAVSLGVKVDGILHVVLVVVLAAHVKGGGGAVALAGHVPGLVQPALHAQHSNQREVVPSASVALQRLVQIVRAFAVSGPPLGQFWVLLLHDVALQLNQLLGLVEHARDLLAVRVRLLVGGHGRGDVAQALEVLGVVVEGGTQVDAIMLFRHFQRLVPLPACLVQLVQQVEPLAPNKQLVRVRDETEVHGHGGHSGVHLLVLRRLAYRPRPRDVPHVAQAVLRHIQPLGLDAHVHHVLPHVRVLDLLHRFVRLVHVANREEVRE
mmetsp:Transcript_8154/g.15501  ORF Transcript_8154/g.15501 Transcript_8154/m.15501 type:complete len:360 (+) Transcript_8154:1290-2369(+)